MSKTWIIGDIHGCFKALEQIFDRTPIEEGDTIISLGDIADGWSQTYECVEFLLNLQKKYNCIFIKGNHDDWFLDYLLYGQHPGLFQGGKATLVSYCNSLDRNYVDNFGVLNTNLLLEDIPISHIEFFKNQLLYYRDENNNFFVHGGFDRNKTIEFTEKIEPFNFYWDRDLWNKALSAESWKQPKLKTEEDFNEIFIGHTSTMFWGKDKPMKAANIWNLDTGAGSGAGRLTIMNLETKEYYQSDPVNTLYPNERGRN